MTPRRLVKKSQQMSNSLQECGRTNTSICKTPVSVQKLKTGSSHSEGKFRTSTPIKVLTYDSVEEAISKINFIEMKKMLDMSHRRFPDSPVPLLTDLVSFLNLKLNVKDDDPVYISKPKLYPLNICPKELTDMIECILSDCTPDILKPFLESVLKSVAEDCRKGLSTIGYHIVIQAAVLRWPNVVLGNMDEMIKLRNVYKNSQTDCLTFLWIVGQVGVSDLNSGIKVWMEVMMPLLGIKAYSPFIVQYLKDLVSWHSQNSTSLVLEIHTYFPLMDVIFCNSVNLDISSHRELMNLYQKLKYLTLRSDTSRKFFPSYLRRLGPTCRIPFKEELLSNLTVCLMTDERCFCVWTQLFRKHVPQSKELLEHILQNWDNLWNKLPVKMMTDTFQTWLSQNKKTVPSNVVPQFEDCCIICQELMSKMQSSNTKNHNPSSKHKNRNNVASNPQPHFPWILIIFVSLAALAGLVMYDVTTKGSFKASNTRQILNDWGISSACCTSWKFVSFHVMNVFRWSQTNVPVYYKTAIEFCAPYVNLAKVKSYELGTSFLTLLDVLSANISEMTLPVLTWLDVNVPPFLKTVRDYFVEGVTYVGTILTPIFNGALEVACNIYKWFMENVFIGQLDPQNLQNSAISAMSAVQEYTVSMFRWVSQQVYTS